MDYHAGGEIRDILQGRNGILYFANNNGLLSFDGSYWKLAAMPNKEAIRSMALDSFGRIYVGGQDELGYFFPDGQGVLRYHSMKDLVPKNGTEGQFADIWDIVIMGQEVFFRGNEIILRLKDNKITVYDASGGWRLLESVGSTLYAEDKRDGLVVFKDGHWLPCCPHLQTARLHITGILEYKRDSLLIATQKNGLYWLHDSTLSPRRTAADGIFSNDLLHTIKRLGADRYAIGTAQHGVILIDSAGHLIQQYSTGEGLQSTNIHRIAVDEGGNLWLALENGIAFINYRSAVTHIVPEQSNQTTSSALAIFRGRLYVGTANGLYCVPVDSAQRDLSAGRGLFTEVGNTKGIVWSLMEKDGQLLMGHQEGAFVIEGGKAIPLMTSYGVWLFRNLPSSGDVIAGTYTGLQLLRSANGAFRNEGKIDSFYESLGSLAIDENEIIWASHPYRGVFRIELAADRKTIVRYRQYGCKDGLPSSLNNYIYRIRGKIRVATERGLYEYEEDKGKFVPSVFFTPIFKDSTIEYLTEDKLGNIWFVNGQRAGIIDFRKSAGSQPFSLIYFPELTAQTLRGFKYILPYDDENVFFGSDNGVYHLNYSRYLQSEARPQVLLSSVRAMAQRDSLLFGGFGGNSSGIDVGEVHSSPVRLPNGWNSFHFEYASTLFAERDNVEFSYRLTGFDREWSDWSGKTEKDYTNLPYGSYQFSVRARNNLGKASPSVNYSFTVAPAWYQTGWAWAGYLLATVALLSILIRWQQRRFVLQQRWQQEKNEEEQRRLSYLHNLELDRTEKEIIALQKDKLEAELQFKTKELATVTMHLVKRGGIVLGIKQELMALIQKLQIPNPAAEFRSVFRMFADIEKNGEEWNQFALYFDQVHNNFISILKTKFPGLSATDLKLCAYLRLNLSSKEIAQLLNISLKGVEIGRYRVRKKFGLSPEINLYDFLLAVTRTAEV